MCEDDSAGNALATIVDKLPPRLLRHRPRAQCKDEEELDGADGVVGWVDQLLDRNKEIAWWAGPGTDGRLSLAICVPVGIVGAVVTPVGLTQLLGLEMLQVKVRSE